MRIEIEITKTKSKIMYFNFLVRERKEAEKKWSVATNRYHMLSCVTPRGRRCGDASNDTIKVHVWSQDDVSCAA